MGDVILHLTVTEFGATKMLRATSEQMPNLMVTGTDEADLWECLGPVIESLFEAQGERVQGRAIANERLTIAISPARSLPTTWQRS